MPPHPSSQTLAQVTQAIVSCRRCARLRNYCQHVAREKRAAYRNDEYWGKPVPGFGDPRARVLLLGLAPAAHGANRTGRVFTGDGAGGSGDFLMAALHRAGFANMTTSTHPDDGLALTDAYIVATVRCAPPDNKPLPDEIAACADHLDAELAALRRIQIVVALGKIAWDGWFQHLARHGRAIRPRPAFGHNVTFDARAYPAHSHPAHPAHPHPAHPAHSHPAHPAHSHPAHSHPAHLAHRAHPAHPAHLVIGCYHPSRQNTNTGKVTPAMYDDVFANVRAQLRP